LAPNAQRRDNIRIGNDVVLVDSNNARISTLRTLSLHVFRQAAASAAAFTCKTYSEPDGEPRVWTETAAIAAGASKKKAGDGMANRRRLQWIGIFYGCITIAITLVASLVVSDHVSGRLSLETAQAQASEISAALR
jgi:hypothetical protein